jgi:hypothetical protein
MIYTHEYGTALADTLFFQVSEHLTAAYEGIYRHFIKDK